MPDDLVFESDDLGATEQFLNEAYTKMRIGGDTRQSHSRIARSWVGPVNFDRLEFSYDMSYDASPLGKICICRVESGRIEENFIGEAPDTFGPGDVTLFTPPDLPYSGQICKARYDLTMFDPELLDRVAATAPTRAPQSVRLLGHRPVSAEAGAHLSSVIGYLRDHVIDAPGIRDDSLVAATAAQHLAASVLHALPNNAQHEPTATDRKDASTMLLRRAVAFIEDNAHADIAIRDIASAIHVTPRAVQYMFRRHLDTTPMQYLRRVRLHRAHHDLMVSDPATTTVREIAIRWGFAHVGRFAVLYREIYGVSPRATLRR